MIVHIGLDDTDSKTGGCTTYTATEAIKQILKGNLAKFLDYPRLIRLNPNIPWKTRGNGAVALTLEVEEPEDVFQAVCRSVQATLSTHIDAAVILVLEKEVDHLKQYAERALHTMVTMREAKELCERIGAYVKLWGKGSGLKGALASVGNRLNDDYTFELLAYRRPNYWGKPRGIDPESVYAMDRLLGRAVFNNYDPETGRILITPHGPDPVYFGIRGEVPEVLVEALSLLKLQEPIDRWVIFRTNQGTAQHLLHELNPKSLKAYDSGYVRGIVESRAVIERGGHLYLTIEAQSTPVKCAVYEPTGPFRNIFQQLVEGDLIEVGGGVRRATAKHPKVLNVEYLKVVQLKKVLLPKKPICDICKKPMKSKGGAGYYRCRRCGLKKKATEFVEVPRGIKEGVYLPPPRAQRHLTKPLQRWGLEKQGWDGKMISRWYWFSDLCDL
jgi:tRNA(Ile2)-agmatinylcytidine synthase